MDGYRPFIFGNTRPTVSITRNGVTFNKVAVDELGNPPYALLLVNEEAKILAVKKASASNPLAIPFCAVKKGGTHSVRWNSKELLRVVCNMTGWNLNTESCAGYKIFASHDKLEEALMIDLTTAVGNT